MTSAVEARHRLDRTLSSAAFSDSGILGNLVRKQLHKTSGDKLATDEVVEKKSNQLLKLLDALRSAKGERTTRVVDGEWKVKQDTSRFRVMYREGPEGAPYHSLCLDGIIDGSMSDAVVVGCEVPMYKEWWPQFTAPTFKIVESKWLERDTVGGDYSVLRFKVPWPFAMREVILSAFELEYADEDLVAVLYNSAPDLPIEEVDGISSDRIPELHGVRMDVDGGFVLQRIGKNCNFFRIVVDLDMKLDLVPPWLINFIARQLVGHGYKLYQKAVAGVKGSKLEKLANSDPMYKRIQALDSMPLNIYEPTLAPMSPSEIDAAGFYEGSYKPEEKDSVESILKSLTDQELSEASKPTSENKFLEEIQHTAGSQSESNLRISTTPKSNGLFNGEHELNPDRLIPTADINGKAVATVPQELQLHTEEGEPTDPEVVWALEVLEKYITHFKNRKAAAQACGSRDTPGVQFGIADDLDSVRSTAKVDSFHDANEDLDTEQESALQTSASQLNTNGKGCSELPELPASFIKVNVGATIANESGTKVSLTNGQIDSIKRVKSDTMIALPEDQQIIAIPRTQSRGFRFFKFRRRHKDKEKAFKRLDESAV